MAPLADSVQGVESQRLLLETNLSKLRKSLRHWQAWEVEYEGLKEEVMRIGKQATTTELEKVASGFGGGLVDEKGMTPLHLNRGPLLKGARDENTSTR